MIDTLVEALQQARSVAVLTGAGISADSGIPTFREAQTGLWAQYRPEDLATPEAFERDPDMVWQWNMWRRQKVTSAEPNAGHQALAALEARLPDLRLITQNVDGLHQRAGHCDVIEFHGNITVNRCHREGRIVEVDQHTDSPPVCPHCGGPVRPGNVWFGEAIPEEALQRATEAAQACELFMYVGTSAQVQPAAGLGHLAQRNGARLAEINPDDTVLSRDVDIRIQARAAEVLPQVVAKLG
ncbi:MAG: NAD-dependent deacylase [Halofilum sp. (in: g-proteobacteria)]